MELLIIVVLALVVIHFLGRAFSSDVDYGFPYFIAGVVILFLIAGYVAWICESKIITTSTAPVITVTTQMADSTLIPIDTLYTFTFKLTD